MLAQPADADDAALGRRIYLEGVGEGGKPITGVRFGGVVAQGAVLACVTCHKRSGLGSTEGTDTVSPIAGRFIFQDAERAVASCASSTRCTSPSPTPALPRRCAKAAM
jgi:hypothetical protein